MKPPYDQPPMRLQAAPAGHNIVRHADGWVDITRFRLPEGADDRTVLAALRHNSAGVEEVRA